MIEHLMEKHNYVEPSITLLKNLPIREYDMTDAGFSIIKEQKLFSKDLIDILEKTDKKKRHIYIGKILKKEPSISKIMMEQFKEIRKEFARINNINVGDVLSIKKDAIFLIDKPAVELTIGSINFALKNTYSSYYRINNEEYYLDSRNDILDIKGLNKEIKNYHKDKFLSLIKEIMIIVEPLTNKREIISLLRTYQSKYLEGELDVEIYREMKLEPLCNFKVGGEIALEYFDVYTDEFTGYFDELDISYNYLTYLLPLIQILIQ